MIDSQDMTGQPVSIENIDEALQAATSMIMDVKLMASHPHLVVQAGNIHACLRELRAIRMHLAAAKAGR